MALHKLLNAQRIIEIDASDRDGALRALCEVALNGSGGPDLETLHKAVLDREALLSTGFGGGLAMPHVRLPAVRAFQVALGRASAPVPFDAVDGEPVRLFLLIVGPSGEKERYQKLMAKAARFLKEEGPRLLEAKDLATVALEALGG